MFAYCNNNPTCFADHAGNLPNQNISAKCYMEGGGNYSQPRDVTDEVMSALEIAAEKANRYSREPYSLGVRVVAYWEFYTLVDHGAAWDIKRETSWHTTIGTPFPGEGVAVIFDGAMMTPEDLGNFTYGYLGEAYSIPLIILLAGSYYAAGFPTKGDALYNEVVIDWANICTGYIYAKTNYMIKEGAK